MTLDNYTRIKVIGKGSYGEVWLGRHKRDKKLYVLKRMDLQKASKRERGAAEQEAKLLSKLRHPNIVSYKDSFETDTGYLYITMQYCEGGDLYTKLKEQKGALLEERQVVEWFVQISMALQYMHERNILHRDLKTQNIFLTKSKIIKVGDLGIARVLDGNNDMATTLIGTPYYMSPELFSNKPYNHKSDVWALGCCVYEMTTLKHAFNAKDMNSLVYKILRGKMPAMPKLYDNELVTLIKAMLNQEPDKRPSVNRVLRHPFIKRNIQIFLEGTKAKQRVSSASSVSSTTSSIVQSDVISQVITQPSNQNSCNCGAGDDRNVISNLEPIAEHDFVQNDEGFRRSDGTLKHSSEQNTIENNVKTAENKAVVTPAVSCEQNNVIPDVLSDVISEIKSKDSNEKLSQINGIVGSDMTQQKNRDILLEPCIDSNLASSNDASNVAHSNDASNVVSSNDASNVVSSNDASNVVSSNDASNVAHSNDASNVVSSNDASNVVSSNDASNVVSSNDASNVVSSNDASNVVSSNDASNVAPSNVNKRSARRRRKHMAQSEANSSTESVGGARTYKVKLISRQRPLPPPPKPEETNGLPSKREGLTPQEQSLQKPDTDTKSSGSSKSSSTASSREQDESAADDGVPRSAPNLSARERRRKQIESSLTNSQDRPNSARRLKLVRPKSAQIAQRKEEVKVKEIPRSRHRQPSLADDSSSSAEETEKVSKDEKTHVKREKREISDFLSVLDTTLKMNRDTGDPSDDESEGMAVVVGSDHPVVVDRRVQALRPSSMPGEATLDNTDRLIGRIRLLRRDCRLGIGDVKLRQAHEILEKFEDDEIEPKLVDLLGKKDFDIYAGKIWQLKFCEDSAFHR